MTPQNSPSKKFLLRSFWFIPIACFTLPLAEGAPPNARTFAVGIGPDAGLVGIRATQSSENSRWISGIALSIEGVIPQFHYVVSGEGSTQFFVSEGVLFNPWGGVALSCGALVNNFGIGIHHWDRKGGQKSLFWEIGLAMVHQLRGTAEGGPAKGEVAPNLFLGMSF